MGAASRDVADDDPRGWRLGGGVSYSALAAARLGLPTRRVIGVDAKPRPRPSSTCSARPASTSTSCRSSAVPSSSTSSGPRAGCSSCHSPSDPIPTSAVPEAWRGARGWLLAPVARELPADWADAPPPDAIVALGWQGLLRELTAGEEVGHVRPGPDPVVARADLAGLSRDDVDRGVEIGDLYRLSAATRHARRDPGRPRRARRAADLRRLRLRHYPAVRSHDPVDATGAGDVFLAALAAARIEPRLVGGRLAAGYDLLMAAAAASLVLEGPGMLGVPHRAAVRARMAEAGRWLGGGAAGTRSRLVAAAAVRRAQRGAGPVDSRTRRLTGTDGSPAPAPRIVVPPGPGLGGGERPAGPAVGSSAAASTAQRPISAVAWAIVVSGGSTYAARSTSSNPTTLTSAGTRRPAARTARIAPIAMRSL